MSRTAALVKRCTCCGRELELDEFYTDRGRPTPRCRNCKRMQIARIQANRVHRCRARRQPCAFHATRQQGTA